MKKEDTINKLLSSIIKGDKHIVRIKVDTILKGSLAVQFKLLRALKNQNFNEPNFIRMLLIVGLAETNKTVLKEVLSIKGMTYGMLIKMFDDIEKEI